MPPIISELAHSRALQRRVLPRAAALLDWFHLAMRFEHALQTASGLGAGTVDAHLGIIAHRDIERAKWRLWHGRWKGCLIKLAEVCRWTEAKRFRENQRHQNLAASCA